MNGFLEEFRQRAHGKPGSTNVSYQKYISARNAPAIKLMCFVEGSSDSEFYIGVLLRTCRLTRGEIVLIHNQDSLANYDSGASYEDDRGGKRSVVEVCDRIRREDPSLRKCRFIVDRDYDGLEGYKQEYPPETLESIWVLPCYSFENYYFTDYNLERCFRVLFLSRYAAFYNEFKECLQDFMTQISKYNAWKRLTVMYALHEQEPRTRFACVHQDLGEGVILNLSLNETRVDMDSKLSLFVECAVKELFDNWPKERLPLLKVQFDEEVHQMSFDTSLPKGKLLFHLLFRYLKESRTEGVSRKELFSVSSEFECIGIQ